MDSRQPELSRLTLMCSDHEVAEFTWNHDRQAVTGNIVPSAGFRQHGSVHGAITGSATRRAGFRIVRCRCGLDDASCLFLGMAMRDRIDFRLAHFGEC